MQAAGKELVPAVDGGLLGLVHQDELLAQTQPARVVAGPVGLAAGEDPPLHLRLDPLVLEGPDVAAQLGSFLLAACLKEALWFPYLSFQEGALTPTYFIRGFPSAVTSAW